MLITDLENMHKAITSAAFAESQPVFISGLKEYVNLCSRSPYTAYLGYFMSQNIRSVSEGLTDWYVARNELRQALGSMK